MKRSGPLFTLLGGLLLALLMLSLNATTGTSTTSSAGGEKPATKVSPSPAPDPTKTTTPPGPSPSPPGNADYAGRTDDDSAAVAVSLRDGRAIAYFCDGRDQESWLKGDVKADGTMRLTSQRGGVLNGELKGSRISGTVDMGQQEYGFTADKALKPSGLYRATDSVRGAEIDGGWIVLPDGQQVGIVKRDGTPSAAPRIDPETGAVTVDGQQLTARPVQL